MYLDMISIVLFINLTSKQLLLLLYKNVQQNFDGMNKTHTAIIHSNHQLAVTFMFQLSHHVKCGKNPPSGHN